MDPIYDLINLILNAPDYKDDWGKRIRWFSTKKWKIRFRWFNIKRWCNTHATTTRYWKNKRIKKDKKF